MLRIAIVEDEPVYAEALEQGLRRYSDARGEKVSLSLFPNGTAFLAGPRAEYDAVFMDIAMPGIDGMETARRFRERDAEAPLVFVTGMGQYAIRGYEVGAMAFVEKPFPYSELALTMDRVLRVCRNRPSETVTLRSKDLIRVVEVRRITYVEVYNHDLIYHTEDEALEVRGKLSSVEEDPRFRNFIKVSSSHLVNGYYVTEIGQETVTAGGVKLPLSRRRRKECMTRMAEIAGEGTM